MKSVASAPGKVILLGEHFVVYGTKAILASINKRVTVTSTKTSTDSVDIKSTLGKISIPKFKLDVNKRSPFLPFVFIAKKMYDTFNYEGGLEVNIESELPSGVGLGSSSACCVAGAASITGLFKKYSKEKILELAIQAEQTIFKNTSGADSTVCTLGGIIEYDKQNGATKIETIPTFNLVIVNSQISHSTNKVVTRVNKFKEENYRIFNTLCENEDEIIQEAKTSILNNNHQNLGHAFRKNQNLLEKIGISNDKLRKIINIANETSFGAKITGAGDGGCVIVLTDESNLEQTLFNLKKKNFDCFSVKIDTTGLDNF